MVSRPDDPAADAHGRVAVDGRGNLLYGHTKAVIDELLARGADVRFGTANQFIDPAVTLAVGHYGNVVSDGTGTSGAFHPTRGRARIAHGEEIEQQLFAALGGGGFNMPGSSSRARVARYHNPEGISGTAYDTAAGINGTRLGLADHHFGQCTGISDCGDTGEKSDVKIFPQGAFGHAGPNGIAFDSKGNAYVINAGSNEVYKMTHLGAVIDMWGGHGSDDGQFAHMARHGGMMGIAIGPNGKVFITDQGNFRVQVFTQEGKFSREFGTRGTGNGQFLKPTHVAADSEGNVYVTDWERRDVQKFKFGASGYEWVLTFGGKETVDLSLIHI